MDNLCGSVIMLISVYVFVLYMDYAIVLSCATAIPQFSDEVMNNVSQQDRTPVTRQQDRF
jgi:hypothetical protein